VPLLLPQLLLVEPKSHERVLVVTLKDLLLPKLLELVVAEDIKMLPNNLKNNYTNNKI
jgi:hypothetical protein